MSIPKGGSGKPETFSILEGSALAHASREVFSQLPEGQRIMAQQFLHRATVDHRAGQPYLDPRNYRELTNAASNTAFAVSAAASSPAEIIAHNAQVGTNGAAARAAIAVLREADLITEARTGGRTEMPRITSMQQVHDLTASTRTLSYLNDRTPHHRVAQDAANMPAPVPTSVTIQRGDTLTAIANRSDLAHLRTAAQATLGPDAKPDDVTRAVVTSIALVNGIKDPNKINAGATLTLPDDAQVRTFAAAARDGTTALAAAQSAPAQPASQQVAQAPRGRTH